MTFAWFEDKVAALRWYYGEMHRGAQNTFFPDRPRHVPLNGVPDDVGPIMVIASITVADSARFAETSLPNSQIAIELIDPFLSLKEAIRGRYWLERELGRGGIGIVHLAQEVALSHSVPAISGRLSWLRRIDPTHPLGAFTCRGCCLNHYQ